MYLTEMSLHRYCTQATPLAGNVSLDCRPLYVDLGVSHHSEKPLTGSQTDTASGPANASSNPLIAVAAPAVRLP
jgi:hypothetical protein